LFYVEQFPAMLTVQEQQQISRGNDRSEKQGQERRNSIQRMVLLGIAATLT